ncbi:MAG: superoxide dismutase [Rickettsiaceae bacterium]|nr:MAG: superoxide dismutase [Rickettsiaceae bacterium]
MTYSPEANQKLYPFTLPPLPYSKSDFDSKVLSPETFDYHYEKHHQSYVTNLNNLLANNKELVGKELEDIIILANTDHSLKAIFNNAAQLWNHSFFWHSIKPTGGGMPNGDLLNRIEARFGSFDNFKSEFKNTATGLFGSGWTWLVLNEEEIQIIKTSNADTPITTGMQPLLVCDVWEHAYYIDFRNKRADFVDCYIEKMINWDFAQANLSKLAI